MVDYPPYVDAYGLLKELFKKIREAGVPPKFTTDFLSAVLELKSSSYRPMIPFLKKLGFVDENNVPTQMYRDYRDESKSKIIMAKALKTSFRQLYSAHEYAHTLPKEQIISKLSSILGTSKDDITIPKVAATFIELRNLADFEGIVHASPPEEKNQKPVQKSNIQQIPNEVSHKLGISYTINLNLPATNDVGVFNAIFKSLKDNLLK